MSTKSAGRIGRKPITSFQAPVLVPRSRTFEVDERLTATGERLIELDPSTLPRSPKRGAGAAAVAVLSHSYLDPVHEIAIGRQLRGIAWHLRFAVA
jgi:N-methylhydantoinase A/oxoprolinase/acetone carboxylase beta subunit